MFIRNESLLTWSHTSSPMIIPTGITPASLNRLQLVAECFRDAAFIYLHSILERMSMKSANLNNNGEPESTSGSMYSTEWAALIFTPKSTAVHRCLARVETFPLDNHCEYSALTFPLFISGAESEVPAHRDLVIQALNKLQDNFGIGNVRRAKELLGILWARKDDNANLQGVHWQDILEELQWDVILA